jgi:hypothetical protein
MATPKSTLSKFILSLPATLTGAQVVAQAKARGLKTSRANVSRVRNLFRGPSKGSAPVPTTGTSAAAAKTEPAKPSAATSKPRSKAEFVRSFPTSTSPKEIVKKAKAAGIKLGAAYVYNVWTRDKTGTAKEGPTAKPTSSTSSKATNGARAHAAPTNPNAESLLRAIAAEVGLGRAIELLQGERARIHSILKG